MPLAISGAAIQGAIMKKLLFASLALAVLNAGAALAADMPVKARPLPPPVDQLDRLVRRRTPRCRPDARPVNDLRRSRQLHLLPQLTSRPTSTRPVAVSSAASMEALIGSLRATGCSVSKSTLMGLA